MQHTACYYMYYSYLYFLITGEKFQELMTADEKKKLYDAMGYSESTADPNLPLEVGYYGVWLKLLQQQTLHNNFHYKNTVFSLHCLTHNLCTVC